MNSRADELARNLAVVQEEIATFAPTLIVVTKTYPISDVEILSHLGVKNFGENRSSEGVEKSASVAAHWHYQGQVQGKKIREVIGWASTIHSLDNFDHAMKMDRVLTESGKEIEVFLQLSLDGDPSRGGLVESQLFTLAEQIAPLASIRLLGIMCVPPVELSPTGAYREISAIHQKFAANFPKSPALSAGMSGDYLIALAHGATHIRVGSKILGSREYH